MVSNATSPRPRNLKEAVFRGGRGDRDAFLREFLDEFYTEADAEGRAAMIVPAPEARGDAPFDAFVAAVAEHLAFVYGPPVPDWCLRSERFLRRAYFPCGLESLKATELVESPTAFRRRMIFVEADPLYRPRWEEAPATPFRP